MIENVRMQHVAVTGICSQDKACYLFKVTFVSLHSAVLPQQNVEALINFYVTDINEK